MIIRKLRTVVLAVLAASFVAWTPAQASLIPYPNPGVLNPTSYSFVASSTGNITGYFYGSSAAYETVIEMLVNGVPTGITGLNNHSSPYGQSLNLGAVNIGDTIVFRLLNLIPGGIGPFHSDTSLNSDGLNHVYSTAWATDGIIPNGTYIGFEDLLGGGDKDYNDEQFVITNISRVPEPATVSLIVLLLLSTIGFGVVRARSRVA